jgi:hypothetical protein
MRMDERLSIACETYSGCAADERPVAIRLGPRRVAVREIRDRWLGEDHAYFKCSGEDGVVYLIRHDRRTDTWELRGCEAPAAPPWETHRT